MSESLEDLMAKRRQKTPSTTERYIYDQDGGYRVRIRLAGQRRDFGTYDAIEDAIAVRDAALARYDLH